MLVLVSVSLERRQPLMPSSSLTFPQTEPALAATFASLWWGWHGQNEGFVSIFNLPQQSSLFVPLVDLERAFIDNGLDDLTYVGGGRGPQNLYHSVGVYGNRPVRGRGRAADIARTPGVWLDCDVKFGGFSGEEQIYDLVRAFDVAGMPPHIIVKTGPAGGHHLYWRTERPLLREGGEIEEFAHRVWLYANSLVAEGVSIDRLFEPNRVMRLPGSLWWGKGGGEEGGGSLVQLIRSDACQNDTLSLERLREASQPFWQEWEDARAEAHKRRRAGLAQATLEWSDDEDVRAGLGRGAEIGRWGMLARLEAWEADFNESVSWEQILVPAGWVCTGGPDAEGRMSWRRPVGGVGGGEGVNPRSLVTDWVESPHVAKLMSDSPETRLLHLEKAGLPMTKLNVMAALYFSDNTHETLLRWYKAQTKLRPSDPA